MRRKKRKPKFFDEFSKIALIVILVSALGCIVTYAVACFLYVDMSVSYATTAMTAIVGVYAAYCLKSYGQKASLNRNHLTVSDDGEVSDIDTEAKG